MKIEVITVSGTHCLRGRNLSAQAKPIDGPAACKQVLPYDYYLAMDDDMAFTGQTVQRLVDLNLDVVGAAYTTRSGPDAHLIVACPLDKKNKQDWFKIWDKGLQECLWVGGGCLLIKKTVFESMDYPYFHNEPIFEELAGVKYGDIQTEDISFCCRAREAGYRVFVDLDNRVGHIPT
jgi:GT2 family glycosyltransferase